MNTKNLINKKFIKNGNTYVIKSFNDKYGNYVYFNQDENYKWGYASPAKLAKLVEQYDNLETIANVVIDFYYTVIRYEGRNKKPYFYDTKQTKVVRIKYNNKTIYNQKLDNSIFQLEQDIINLYQSNEKYYKKIKVETHKVTDKEMRKYIDDPKSIPMLSVAPKQYSFIKGDLNAPEKHGLCVPEFLLKYYKEHIPSLTIEKITNIIKEEDENYNSLLGTTVNQVQIFCEHYNISHYAIDMLNYVFFKEVMKSSNYPALIYYCANEHMYPVLDKATRATITKAVASKNKSGTHLYDKLFNDDNGECDDNNEIVKRFKLPMHQDIDNKDLVNYKDCNIFYHTGNLYDKLIELFIMYNKQYKCTFSSGFAVCIKFDNNVNLYSNANHRCKLDWNDSIKLCELFKVPFRNQSLQSLSLEIFQSFHYKGSSKLHARKNTNVATKKKLLKEQNNKCNNCKECVGSDPMAKGAFEVDHIIALMNGGDNDITNLQILCKECHKDKTKKEMCEKIFNIDGIISSFNNNTKHIFTASKNAFIHTFKEKYNEQLVSGLDINKCRRNIMLNNNNDYCVYSVLDDIEQMNEKYNSIPIGYYYIVTDRFLPFKGNGWYSYVLVKYALDRKLIDHSNIKYIYKPSFTVKADYFNDFINHIISNAGDKSKFMINGFIGMLGHKMRKTKKVYLTNSLNEASYLFFNKNASVKHNKDNGIIECAISNEYYLDDNYCPIFNQIIDMEAIELHKICKLIMKNKGTVVCVNTDNAIGEFKNEKDIIQFKKQADEQGYFDADKKVKKYKEESEIKFVDRKDVFNTNVFNYNKPFYNIIDDPMTNNFESLITNILKMNKSIQIQGMPGTGKTTLLKGIIEQLRKDNKMFAMMTPTNKACRQLDKEAVTIHSFIKKTDKNNLSKLNAYEYLIIDEKSMIKELYYRVLFNIKQNCKCKIILSGDWKQLDPVQDRSENFNYENSSVINYICDSNLLVLSKCRRSDSIMFDHCSNIDKVNPNEFGNKLYPRSISYTNAKRKEINDTYMQKFKTNNSIIIEKNKKDPNSQEMILSANMPVIACVTNNSYDIVNAEEFYISEDTFKKNAKDITIYEYKQRCPIKHRQVECNKKVIKLDEFNKIFYPAYCITCHRSQGATFNHPYTILEWGKMDEKLKFVALSRTTKKEFVNIII